MLFLFFGCKGEAKQSDTSPFTPIPAVVTDADTGSHVLPIEEKTTFKEENLPEPEGPSSAKNQPATTTKPTPPAKTALVPATTKPRATKPAVSTTPVTPPRQAQPAETKPVSDKPATKKDVPPPPPPPAPETTQDPPPTTARGELTVPAAPAYLAPLNALLGKHVSATGRVNYAGLKADKAELDRIATLLSTSRDEQKGREEQLAYYINLYNVYTLKLIVDNYPVKSITDLHGGKPWDVKWVPAGSDKLSLNQIENEIIRPTFKEPRIHFAVNCAAASCPPLLNAAWDPAKLEAQFAAATKAFVNNTSYNQLSKSTIKLSKIFEWYAGDFGDINAFIGRYTSTNVSGAKVQYLEYDWSLNSQ